MKEVCDFLKKAGTYYLATCDGDQPRVRPFGTAHIFEDKLYIHTDYNKDVSKQMAANPKIEISAFDGEVWVRICAVAVNDTNIEAAKSMLAAYPALEEALGFKAGDGRSQVLYLKDATASFYSFASPEVKTVTF